MYSFRFRLALNTTWCTLHFDLCFKTITYTLRSEAECPSAMCHGEVSVDRLLVPCCTTALLLHTNATFSFSCIRDELPGIMSVAAQKRVAQRECKRLMSAGHSVDGPRLDRALALFVS